MEMIEVDEDTLVDAFTSWRLFVLINSILSWVVISRVFFLGKIIGTTDMGFMTRGGPVGLFEVGMVLVVVSIGRVDEVSDSETVMVMGLEVASVMTISRVG